ncbi:MAG: hypothetical protein ABWX94_01810 [Candidatus Saccharimonadales bacterium]
MFLQEFGADMRKDGSEYLTEDGVVFTEESVRRLGVDWRVRCLGEIAKMTPETGIDPKTGDPIFDGAGSGREED